MATRLRLVLLGAGLAFATSALAQSAVQVGPGGTPGPGGMALAPGPAGSQTGGIQNLSSQAATLLSGCTIPSPIFNIFANARPGITNVNPAPLPLTSISGC